MAANLATEGRGAPLTAEQRVHANEYREDMHRRVERAAAPEATIHERFNSSRRLLYDVAMFGSGGSANHRCEKKRHEAKLRELIDTQHQLEEIFYAEQCATDILVRGECSAEQRLHCEELLAASRDTVDMRVLAAVRIADTIYTHRKALLALKDAGARAVYSKRD